MTMALLFSIKVEVKIKIKMYMPFICKLLRPQNRFSTGTNSLFYLEKKKKNIYKATPDAISKVRLSQCSRWSVGYNKLKPIFLCKTQKGQYLS